jgi:hypothetical protein
MDISNKTLAMFLIAAMVISLTGTLVSLTRINQLGVTGAATDSDEGFANLTIQTQASLEFTKNAIDWGTGRVNTSGGNQYCNLSTDGPGSDADDAMCHGFTYTGTANSADGHFVLNNTGNVNFSTVNLTSNKFANTFITGTTPSLQFKAAAYQGTPCSGAVAPATYTIMNTTNNGTTICSNFKFDNSNDEIEIDVFVSIPYDADTSTPGKTVTFTATGDY